MDHRDENLTAILNSVEGGDRDALRAVVPVIYDELRGLAGAVFDDGHKCTLQPTALVHEVFLKMSDQISTQWNNRAHFFAVAAKVMRQLLADHARHQAAVKRGGGWARTTVSGLSDDNGSSEFDLEALDQAMRELDELNPRHGRIVELRFLAGVDIDTTAELMDISPRTVNRDWLIAHAWLRARLAELNT